MIQNIVDGLGIDNNCVHLKVSSMDGHDEIVRLRKGSNLFVKTLSYFCYSIAVQAGAV
jgi:hypothetical protein